MLSTQTHATTVLKTSNDFTLQTFKTRVQSEDRRPRRLEGDGAEQDNEVAEAADEKEKQPTTSSRWTGRRVFFSERMRQGQRNFSVLHAEWNAKDADEKARYETEAATARVANRAGNTCPLGPTLP